MASGIVAVGDSITRQCSPDLALGGLAALSWAQRVAEALREPLEVYARVGASSAEIRRDLLPGATGTYSLALVHVGVNNIVDWRAWRGQNLADDLGAIVGELSQHADRVLVMGYPSSLGRARTLLPYGPGLGRRLSDAGRIAAAVAEKYGAVFAVPPALTGHQVWVDGLHPSSLGHLEMARAALAALGEGYLPPAPDAVRPDSSHLRWRRREAVTFAFRQPPRGVAKWLLTG